MGEGERAIEIVERDGDTVRLVGQGPKGRIEVVADMTMAGGRLVLRGLHADGAGPGSLGLTEVRAYARLLARQMGAKTLEIHGGVRTTGARPGKTPRPVVIHVDVVEEKPHDADQPDGLAGGTEQGPTDQDPPG